MRGAGGGGGGLGEGVWEEFANAGIRGSGMRCSGATTPPVSCLHEGSGETLSGPLIWRLAVLCHPSQASSVPPWLAGLAVLSMLALLCCPCWPCWAALACLAVLSMLALLGCPGLPSCAVHAGLAGLPWPALLGCPCWPCWAAWAGHAALPYVDSQFCAGGIGQPLGAVTLDQHRQGGAPPP